MAMALDFFALFNMIVQGMKVEVGLLGLAVVSRVITLLYGHLETVPGALPSS